MQCIDLFANPGDRIDNSSSKFLQKKCKLYVSFEPQTQNIYDESKFIHLAVFYLA